MLRFLLLVTCVCACLCCERGADCGDNECCMITPGGGVCQPMAEEGQECSVLLGRFPFGKPESAVTSCPCRLGLDCITADPHQFGVEGARGVCQELLLS